MSQVKSGVLVLSILLSAGGHTCLAAEPIRLVADEWYPVTGVAGAAQPGYMVEVAQEILAAAGRAFTYETMQWNRAIKQVEQGEAHCLLGTDQEESPELRFPREDWGRAQTHFYARTADGWRYAGIESLKNVKLGVIDEYEYGGELDDYIAASKGSAQIKVLTSADALEDSIRRLLIDQIDVIPSASLVMESKLDELKIKPDQIHSVGTIGEPYAIQIGCSPRLKDVDAVLKTFDQGLQKMRASGRLEQIMKTYGLSDWATGR